MLDAVRSADRDRFLGALFAPEPARTDLLALLAFDHELARTRICHARADAGAHSTGMVARGGGRSRGRRQAARAAGRRIAERNRAAARLPPQDLIALIDAREEEIEGPLDVLRAGHALADLAARRAGRRRRSEPAAARAVAAAWLMGEGPERDALLAEARALRREVDPAALPILLPALSLGDIGAWRKPLAYWWAARRGRY